MPNADETNMLTATAMYLKHAAENLLNTENALYLAYATSTEPLTPEIQDCLSTIAKQRAAISDLAKTARELALFQNPFIAESALQPKVPRVH
jgi:hypothetical protein